MTVVHVCSPPVIVVRRRVMRCSHCRVRRRIIVCCYEWHGPLATCCTCGTHWSDGERLPRSASRNENNAVAAMAREDWRHAT